VDGGNERIVVVDIAWRMMHAELGRVSGRDRADRG
jgi:hypothetical protein